MLEIYTKFAYLLTNELIQNDKKWQHDENNHEIVKIENEQHQLIHLNSVNENIISNTLRNCQHFLTSIVLEVILHRA